MSQATYKCKACSESVIWKMFGNDGYCLKCQTLRDAAPDMYEALKAFHSAFKNGVIKTNDLATEIAIESAIGLAQAAISKAEE